MRFLSCQQWRPITDGSRRCARDRCARCVRCVARSAASHRAGYFGSGLLSYGVNLFIFAMGRIATNRPPILRDGIVDAAHYADPVPQALILTAIVISFATTALFLVLVLAARGLTGTDHVDGKEHD